MYRFYVFMRLLSYCYIFLYIWGKDEDEGMHAGGDGVSGQGLRLTFSKEEKQGQKF